MYRLPFTIRDLMFSTLVVALILGLVVERTRNASARKQLDDILKVPHVWIWSPPPMTEGERIPIGAGLGIAGEFFYSDKEQFSNPITATFAMIDGNSGKLIAEIGHEPTLGVPGRRSLAANFKSKLYGRNISPGIYIFLVTVFDGNKEVARGSTSVEFYDRTVSSENAQNNALQPSSR